MRRIFGFLIISFFSFAFAQTQITSPLITAAGELQRRIQLTRDRFASGTCPVFTKEFILADVALQPERRFKEFSGDLSGRYIEAAARMPFQTNLDTHQLVLSIIQHQKSDGRFGDENLVFKADAIGTGHMALLWGNGRLLIGLLEAYRAYLDPVMLEAARRLGDFLVAVGKECAAPEVRRNLAGKGAFGFICFTQQIEGLVMLAQATGESAFLNAAEFIAPLLESRGVQHSHGYLATLRGILLLAEAKNSAELEHMVESKYADLIASTDYTIYGSVLEYFGWFDPKNNAQDFEMLQQASGQDPRDEGCGHADFLRLSLALWHATGRIAYLERAENCLLNALFMNQYPSGDFGSKVTFQHGMKPVANIDRAWWCCTMHGYRAFDDVLRSIMTRVDDGISINLYLDADWQDEEITLKLRTEQSTEGAFANRVGILKNQGKECTLFFRQPLWAEPLTLLYNGKEISGETTDRGISIRKNWRKGDVVDVHSRYIMRLLLRDGRALPLDQLNNQSVEAALFYGPWLMSVCEGFEPLFFGEPWQGNQLVLPFIPEQNMSSHTPRLHGHYVHGGFPGMHDLTLCPTAEYSQWDNCTMAVWLNYTQ
jgi:hypothetical protein